MENIRKKIETVVIILLFIATTVYVAQIIAWAKEDEAIRKKAVEEYCAVLQDNPEQLALDLMQIDAKQHENYYEDLLYSDNSGVFISSSENSGPSTPSKPKNPDSDFYTVDEYKKIVSQLKMNPGATKKGVAIVKEYLSTGKTLDISEKSTSDTNDFTPDTQKQAVPHATVTDNNN